MKTIISLLLSISVTLAIGQQTSTDIRLNQIGFLPNAVKVAVVKSATATTFSIKSPDLSTTFYTGLLSAQANWPSSNENVKIADFSPFSTPGKYVLVVPDKGKSFEFKIDAIAFNDLSKAVLKAFYFNRSSTALLQQHAGVYARAEGHPDNAVVVHPSAASANRPAGTTIATPYGWYDAGDYNKYVVNSGISTFTLLSAYESFPTYYDTLKWNIPESDNAIPDILDEALWNIKWLMTMQDPDDGGVYNKTTNANFDAFVMPALATTTRYVVAKGTAATLDFAAIMAMTARIYKPYLPSLADDALAKAERAWQWANAHPNVAYSNPAASQGYPAITTGGYGDATFTDEFTWAAAELYVTTLDDNYYNLLNLPTTSYDIPGWPNVKTLGLLSIVTNRKKLSALADTTAAKNKLIELMQAAKNRHKVSPYRIPTNTFFWGSNSDVANHGMLLMQVYKLTHEQEYFNAALAALDYLIGRNATTYSFVTGFGSKTPKYIHHRPSGADGIAEPLSGFLAGGPNPQNTADDCGTAAYPSTLPALCYLDKECSYSTNEIAINWNAPLAFLAGAIQYEYLHSFAQVPWKFLSVSDRNLSLSKVTNQVQTSVLSNGSWSLSTDQPWCVISPTNGNGNQLISISSSTENTSAVRTAKIMISGEEGLMDSITVTQDIVTSIEVPNFKVRTFPNPASQKLMVDLFDNIGSTTSNITLLSLNGKKVLNKSVNSSDLLELDISHFNNGLYFLILTNQDNIYSQKVIINNKQ
jgi:endoglucanase